MSLGLKLIERTMVEVIRDQALVGLVPHQLLEAMAPGVEVVSDAQTNAEKVNKLIEARKVCGRQLAAIPPGLSCGPVCGTCPTSTHHFTHHTARREGRCAPQTRMDVDGR
jgi:hypothetical protein